MELESRDSCSLGKYSATELYPQLIYFHFEFQLSYQKAPGSPLLLLILCIFKENCAQLFSLPLDFVLWSQGPSPPSSSSHPQIIFLLFLLLQLEQDPEGSGSRCGHVLASRGYQVF